MFRFCLRSKIKWVKRIGNDFPINFRHSLVSGFTACMASEKLRLTAVGRIFSNITLANSNLTDKIKHLFLRFYIFSPFPEGRLTRQAEWGWAGNNGRMGRVGETTASSHQHRCRIIVVCYHVFREYDNVRRVLSL